VIVPRLMVAGADLSRISLFGPDDGTRLACFPDDTELLRDEVQRKQAAMVLIDPVVAYMSADSHRDQDVRRAFTPVGKMAEEENCAIVALRHPSRAGARSGSGSEYGGGSKGFIGLARSGLAIFPAPDDPELLIMCSTMSNFKKAPSQAFRLTDQSFEYDGNLIEVAGVNWVGESDHTFDTLAGDGKRESKQGAAKALFEQMLADGPVDSEAIFAACEQAGISKRTAYLVKQEMGIIAEKRPGFGAAGGWSWRLRNSPPMVAKIDSPPMVAKPSEQTGDFEYKTPMIPIPISLQPLSPDPPMVANRGAVGSMETGPCRGGLPHLPGHPAPGNRVKCLRCGQKL
jgi:hypothetical protein